VIILDSDEFEKNVKIVEEGIYRGCKRIFCLLIAIFILIPISLGLVIGVINVFLSR
jgi:hypothetical protein